MWPFLLLLLAPLHATPDVPPQAKWKEIGTTRTGNPVFINPASVRTRKDGIIEATIRVTFTTPVKTPKGNLTASRANAMFDCATRTFAASENTTYIDEKANTIFQKTVNKVPGFGPTIAGNLADVALQHFCPR
ncbi:MAG: surface-adhesin E family protein [Gemmatimonadaceae bacterium]